VTELQPPAPQPDPDACTIRVLVVDSDERVRESLAGLLQIGRRCLVVASAGDPRAALALLEEHRPDVVILDPRLPEIDGGRFLVTAIRNQSPATRIVVMSSSEPLVHAGIVDGVDAFVRKTFRPRDLVEAVLAAVRHGVAATTKPDEPQSRTTDAIPN
jgi:DNA-binding NarL/FixJ family response regulator